MNGVFKFKENFFLKYKKEIILTVGAVLTLVTVVKFVPGDINSKADETSLVDAAVVEEVMASNGYSIYLNGNNIGRVANMDDGQAAINQAIEMVIAQLGYNPEIEPELTYEDDYSLEENYTDLTDLAYILKDDLIANLDEIKVMAYVMKIGADFTVAVSSEEDIKEILKRAQSIYVNSDMALDITLAKDEHNKMVIKPAVTMVKEDAAVADRTFTGTDGSDVAEEDAAADATEVTVTEVVEEKPKDERVDGVTVSVDFAESVLIVEAYVFEDEIKNVDEATELITKENEEAKVYKVVSGDAASLIAENNDMGLTELYKLNPGLEGNETKLQIGDELVVMVPEPELSIATQEEVVYTESISRGTTYVDNPDNYVSKNTTIDNGYDGVLQITAIVSKVNGDVIGQEITDKTVLTEPKDKVISKGTKPLPAKGATGNYVFPVSNYRITSPFGYRWGAFHYGVDLALPTGSSVSASDGGTVTIAGWYGNYGYLVEIAHGNGVTTRYGHNSKILVTVGQKVAKYEEIAKSGSTGRSTGPHVHFEIRFDGVATDPMKYLVK